MCGIWAFSFDGFGGYGHAVIEVFDRARGRWLLIDVYNNVHALDAATGEPLSALELRQRVLGQGGPVRIVRYGDGRLGYVDQDKLWSYYRRGAAQWYLWWGNAVFSYDVEPLVRLAGRVSRSLEQLAAIATGVHPRIRVLATAENSEQVRRILMLGRQLRWAGIAFLVLLILFALQAVLAWRRRGPTAIPVRPGASMP